MNRATPLVALIVMAVGGCRGIETSGDQGRLASTTVVPVPIVVLGADADKDDNTLLDVRDATRLSNGNIVVADLGRSALITFDSTGRLVRVTGRRGEGPGEFLSPSWLHQCTADSLFAWDRRLGRVTVFDSAGRLSRQFRFPAMPTRLFCSEAGFALVTLSVSIGLPSADSPIYKGDVLFVGFSGDSIGWLGDVPLGQNRPLATVTQFALSGDELFVGSGSHPIEVYSTTGLLRRRVEIRLTRRRPTTQHYEAAISSLVSIMRPGPEQEMARDLMRAIPMPEFLPSYWQVEVDPEGFLWIVTSSPGDTSAVLRRYREDGEELGRILLPAGAEVLEVGAGYVLALSSSPEGSQRLVLYGLPGLQR